MAEPNVEPPTAEELIALADSISQQINDSLSRQTQTLASTLTSVRASIGDVELLLAELDAAIDELLNRRTTSAEERSRLEEEIERMKQSRIGIRDALDRLKATYDAGVAGLQQATDAYPEVVNNVNTAVKDRVNALLSRIRDAIGQVPPPAQPPENQPPPAQGGSRRSRRRHRNKKQTRRTHKGGYIWRKRSSSRSSTRRSSRRSSRRNGRRY